ncbi:MAG: hypothetical protein ACRD28_01680 [Acidobacteriaceae bacterium]
MQVQAAQAEATRLSTEATPIRGTQSFLHTIALCWKRPSLLGLELLWRWGFGIPASILVAWELFRILSSVSLTRTGVAHFSLIDTVTAAQIVSAVADVLLPPIREVARWLLPVLAIAWALASGFGRSAVLKKYDASLRFAPWLMVGLQLLRIVALGASVALWFVGLHWAAWDSLSGSAPDLVFYFVQAIALSFAIFFMWAIISWVFSIAPLLALLEGTGMVASLRNSLRFGRGSLRGLRSKLVEINLVLGVVKSALIVLAMVFCVTPVPFKEDISGVWLYSWWAIVTVVYMMASDFFQVARIVGFVEIWRAANRQPQR